MPIHYRFDREKGITEKWDPTKRVWEQDDQAPPPPEDRGGNGSGNANGSGDAQSAQPKVCPKCGAELESGDTTCKACGATIESRMTEQDACPACGEETEDGKCMGCGQSVNDCSCEVEGGAGDSQEARRLISKVVEGGDPKKLVGSLKF